MTHPNVKTDRAAVEMYSARLDAALACLGRVGAQLRWLANDGTLPRKVRYTLWSLSLDIDDVTAAEADTAAIPDDELVDLSVPPPF
jgi:hypothetical protein